MAWGDMTVGRIALKENHDLSHQVNATTGDQSVSVVGVETMPPLTLAQVRARQEDLAALLDRDLPVVFENKSNHTGFYRVKDVGTTLTEWTDESVQFFNWSLSLTRIGTENAVDVESRLASTVRVNSFALTGERWHAPAVGAYGYYTGSTHPSGSVSRVLADGEGTIIAYRGIPADVHPRWGVTAPNYLRGRARVFVDDEERSGEAFRIATTDWMLTNGLVRVTPMASGGNLLLESFDGSDWSSSVPIDITITTSMTPPFDAITVLRNDLECVVVRLVKSGSPGRTLVDLTLRRGARFVEGYIQTDASATLGVKSHASITTTNNAATGHIVETGDDASGNRLTIGAPLSFTGSTTGAITHAAVTSLAFYMGHVINGTSPATGDSAVNIRDQYIGTLSEQSQVVKR